jgi:hypothetical protein
LFPSIITSVLSRCLHASNPCQLQHITSLEQFYDEISRQLHLPAHFGRNLDALYDSLSGDVSGPFEIVWRDTELAANWGPMSTPHCWKSCNQ